MKLSESSKLNELLELSEKIRENTDKSVIQIRKKIAENKIRDQRDKATSVRSTTRLTNEQINMARHGFKAFFDKMIKFEYLMGEGYMIAQEYSIFINAMLSLESYTRSMFTCLRCGKIINISELKMNENVAQHECSEGEFGFGNRTSWLYIYATFVKNITLKKALALLDEIIEEKN